MLPDYPGIKSELAKWLNEYLQVRFYEHLGPLREIRRVRLFEGTERQLVRSSGERERPPMRENRAEMLIKREDIPHLTFPDVMRKIDGVAREMAEQMGRQTYQTIADASVNAGTSVSAEAKPLTGSLILDTLSTMFIDFRRDGGPIMPSMHVHPNAADAAKKAWDEIDSDPALRKRLDQIIDTKREEWRAREASRRLVR